VAQVQVLSGNFESPSPAARYRDTGSSDRDPIRDTVADLRPSGTQAAFGAGAGAGICRRKAHAAWVARVLLVVMIGIAAPGLRLLAQVAEAAVPDIQVAALRDLYEATNNGAGWVSTTNWLVGDPCSTWSRWAGVTCSIAQDVT
jgi:hypothetical protein